MVYFCFAKAFDKTPSEALGFRSCTIVLDTALMKQFIVSSGDFVVATGIYRMVDHPGRDHVGIRRHCANVPEAESKVPGSFGPLKIRSVAKPAGGRDGRQGSIQVGLRGDKCLMR